MKPKKRKKGQVVRLLKSTADALHRATPAQQDAFERLYADYLQNVDDLLEGATGRDAIEKIDNVAFEVATLLDYECGNLGQVFKGDKLYTSWKDDLEALRVRHRTCLLYTSPSPRDA